MEGDKPGSTRRSCMSPGLLKAYCVPGFGITGTHTVGWGVVPLNPEEQQ